MRVLLILSLALLLQSCGKDERKPLSGEELTRLVSGNTEIGRTNNSGSIYVLNFLRDGKVYLQKSLDKNQIHLGTWSIEGDVITTQWPTSKDGKESRMRYYHVKDTMYEIQDLDDDCGPKGTYCRAFIALPGLVHLEKGAIQQ
jgi:hypothetical protein